jgi:predicted metal-dependent hydrolase
MALAAAVAAWQRGDWFEAHELLEPAWMGTDDALERDLYQGLIKLAAAYVHRARDNQLGVSRNLAGAQDRLARVAARRATEQGVNVADLLAEIRRRLPADGGLADPDQAPPLLQLMEVP